MTKFSEHTYIPKDEIFSIHTKDGKVYENDYNKMELLSGAYVSEKVVNPDEVDKNQMSLFAKGGSMPESSMYIKKRDIDYILIGEDEDDKQKISGKNLYGGFWFDPKFAKKYPQYMKKKNAGGYLAIAQGVKGVAPKSVDKLDEKIAGQIDGTNRPMVFGMPVYAKGGEIFMEVDLRGINDEDYFDEDSYDYINHPIDLATEDLFKLLSKNGIEIDNTKKLGTKGYGKEYVNDLDKQTHYIYHFSLNDVKNKDKFLADLNKLSDKHKVLSKPQNKFRFAKGGLVKVREAIEYDENNFGKRKKLDLEKGSRNWRGLYLDIEPLVWARNFQDGYNVDVYEEQYGKHLGRLNIDFSGGEMKIKEESFAKGGLTYMPKDSGMVDYMTRKPILKDERFVVYFAEGSFDKPIVSSIKIAKSKRGAEIIRKRLAKSEEFNNNDYSLIMQSMDNFYKDYPNLFAKGGKVDYKGTISNDVVEDIVKNKGYNVQFRENEIDGFQILGQRNELEKVKSFLDKEYNVETQFQRKRGFGLHILKVPSQILDFAKGGKVDTHIAETILVQLGGMNRLKMFTGAYNFGALPNGVSFRIKSRGYSLVNYVKITLTPADLYNVEYGRIHNNKYRVIEEDFGLYNDMLVQSFESATNMYLSFARGGSVENFDLMEEYEALSDQNKAIVNLLNLYNPKGRLPRPKQTLKQLNVDEQYMVRQWNVGLQNQVSEELVKKMWGLMYEHSTIKQDYVYNHNKGAGRFLMNAGSDTICQYDFGHNTHLMINDLGYLVDDEIVRSFAQRNASSKRDYNKKTSGHIGVVSAFELPAYLKMNEYSRYFYDNNKRGCLMVLIAPLKDGKVIEGITEVKKNIVIKNAFENGIDGQLVIKEM